MNSFIWISEQMIRISPWKLGDLACWSSPSRGSARRAETRRGSDRFCLEFPLMFSLSFYNVKVGKAAKPYSYQSVCGSWAPISGQRWKVCPSSGLRWTIERSRDSPLRPARLRSQNYRRVFYTSLSLPPPLSPLPFTYPLSSSLSAFLHSLSLFLPQIHTYPFSLTSLFSILLFLQTLSFYYLPPFPPFISFMSSLQCFASDWTLFTSFKWSLLTLWTNANMVKAALATCKPLSCVYQRLLVICSKSVEHTFVC